MAKTKKKKTEDDAKKYKRQRELANARNRKYKSNLSEEKLEEKRKRDRERYHRLKKEKKIKLVAEMSEKEKKEKRKIWKKKKAALRKKKKEEELLLRNTPPHSDTEVPDDFLPNCSRQRQVGRKLVRRDRAKAYRDLKKLKEENKKLNAKVEKYKKRLQKERQKNKTTSPSPLKKVRNLVGPEKVSPRVKKRLFAGFVLEKQLKSSIEKNRPKTKERQIKAQVIGTKILRKYRVQKEFQFLVSYNRNKKMVDGELKYNRNTYSSISVKEAMALRKFYLSDSVSKMQPGKKDYVKKRNIKMQRRVLQDSLKNLHKKFIDETKIKISYSTFTRARPFWVQKPKLRDRETCACAKHENIEFIVKALAKAGTICFPTSHDVVKATVCSTRKKDCMFGKCKRCVGNQVNIVKDFVESIMVSQWINKTEKKIIKGKEKEIKKVVKLTKEYSIDEVITMFSKQIVDFKKHVYAMKHQWNALNSVVENLKEGELVFQIDFSQNYVTKCSSEIQSMHFGASKAQISLHTGVMHYREGTEIKCQSFCTTSDNIDHMAYAVWAHLDPILAKAAADFPKTHTVYFFSDSPSAQYRNKTNVYYMRDRLPKIFKFLTQFSWNFMEAGHGKGAMDGVGGSLKRNADQLVLHGSDIMSASDLTKAFSHSSTNVLEVSSQAIENYKQSVPEKLTPIKGIMKIRQLFWNGKMPVFYGRTMSCFICKMECSHFHFNTISVIPEMKETRRKMKLCVSDVYSSSDEEESFDKITFDSKYDYNDIKPGAFVVVSFDIGNKKKKNFVAVIQRELSDDREAEVMFFKSNDNKIFQPNENDISWISCDQIVGTLPTPEMCFQGERLFYRFENVIDF